MVIFRHVVEMLLNPFFLCLLLFAVFLVRLQLSRNARKAFFFVFILFLVFSTGWLPRLITHKLENQYPAVATVNPQIHWVVVLSGGQSELKDLPANSLLYSPSIKRLVEGVRLYRQLPETKLLLSGGGYGFEIPEALHLAQVVTLFAVPKKNIVLETLSINTADQAREIKKIVHEEPFYLVTSAIHMPRSMILCEAQGLHPIAAPTDYTLYWDDERWGKIYIPNAYNLHYLSISMHEILGRVWTKIARRS